ncbi:hypothetical protein MTO96_052321 [Rhipicephalus appendiculatus]
MLVIVAIVLLVVVTVFSYSNADFAVTVEELCGGGECATYKTGDDSNKPPPAIITRRVTGADLDDWYIFYHYDNQVDDRPEY